MYVILILMISLFSNLNIAVGDQIIGEYWTAEKAGKIAIYKCSNKYCGRIIWRKEAKKDSKNPNEALQNRSVVGIQFMQDFEYEKKSKNWKGGKVYSVDNGRTYKGKMWLENNGNTLKMRGYIGISLLGRTASLERVEISSSSSKK
jgi:Uncharacterized protein conserved in bacteria